MHYCNFMRTNSVAYKAVVTFGVSYLKTASTLSMCKVVDVVVRLKAVGKAVFFVLCFFFVFFFTFICAERSLFIT